MILAFYSALESVNLRRSIANGVGMQLLSQNRYATPSWILIWLIIPGLKNSSDVHSNNKLALIVLFQYVPRLFLIFPLNQRIVKSSGVVTKTAWAGAAYNLLLYMLASHVLGASWYLLSIERLRTCWRLECSRDNGNLHTLQCDPFFLDCSSLGQLERQIWVNITHVIGNCAVDNSGISFNYGMFADALTNHVVLSSFIEKYFYCLWWGLRNLRYNFRQLKSMKSL